MSYYETVKRFHDELVKLCKKLNIVIIADRVWIVDRQTGETTSMSVQNCGADDAQSRR
jgi:hypothetical protein